MKTKLYFSIILLSLFFLVYEKTNAQSPDWLWAKGIGGIGNDWCFSISLDDSGNVYTTGVFRGTADFDPGVGVFNLTSAGSSDIFISKLDSSGNFVWAKKMGGTGSDFGYSIALDPAGSGDVYTTGYFEGTVDFDPDSSGTFNLTAAGGGYDIFISKLDSSGNFVWAKRMGGTGADLGYSITIDPSGSGDVYTTGYFWGTADFDPGPGIFNLTAGISRDIFISKLNSSGNFVWAKRMGGGSDDYVRSIAIDPSGSGDVYTTGWFYGTADFDPGGGIFNLTSAGGADIFISKLDSSGNFVWAKAMGGTGFDYCYSIALDPAGSGNVYTTGHFWGTVDFDPDSSGIFNLTSAGNADIFISKLDGSGNFVWAIRMGGIGGDVGFSIAIDPSGSGEVYNTGYFWGTVDFDPDSLGNFNLTSAGSGDIFISKLDGSGNFVWAKRIGGTINDFGQSLALDASGHVYMAGYFYSPSISFGSAILINADTTSNTTDIFIAKLDNIITGIESVESAIGGSVYPNPATSEFTIYDLGFTIESIVIYDLPGQKVFSQQKTINNKLQTTINISELNPGIYFVTVTDEHGNKMMRKIVKM